MRAWQTNFEIDGGQRLTLAVSYSSSYTTGEYFALISKRRKFELSSIRYRINTIVFGRKVFSFGIAYVCNDSQRLMSRWKYQFSYDH